MGSVPLDNNVQLIACDSPSGTGVGPLHSKYIHARATGAGPSHSKYCIQLLLMTALQEALLTGGWSAGEKLATNTTDNSGSDPSLIVGNATHLQLASGAERLRRLIGRSINIRRQIGSNNSRVVV